MNNENNGLPKFKIQNHQKKRAIENQLEKDISGIVNKNRVFSKNDKETINEHISSRLRAFLDERLSNKKVDSNFNDEYNQKDYNEDYNNYYEEEDDSYYEDDNYNDYYEDDYNNYDNNESKQSKSPNPNTYLPFTYDELQPELPNGDDLEEMILDAVMPAVAQWLDINIDRIVHKVVKESLSNRGMPEGAYSRSKVSPRRYGQSVEKEFDKEERFNSHNYEDSYYKKNKFRDYEEDEQEEDDDSPSFKRRRSVVNKPIARRTSIGKKTVASSKTLRSGFTKKRK